MGAIGGLLGTSGGASGTGYSKPTAPSLTNPVDIGDIQNANTLAQQGLSNQQSFLNAVQPNSLAAIQSQNQLLSQLGRQAQGQGPNPALNQLNQATGQNIASQAALMAGQRGSSANPALIARQAALQGANTQQQAVGQGATMSAQQQLANQQQLAGLQQQLTGQQANATNNYTQATQGEQGQLLGAQAAYNAAKAGVQANINTTNAGLASTQMQGQQGLIGGTLNSLGSLLAKGGKVQRMAVGGQAGQYDNSFQPMSDDQWNATAQGSPPPMAPPPVVGASQPQNSKSPTRSKFATFLKGMGKPQSAPGQATQDQFNYGNPGANQLAAGMSNFGSNLQKAISSAFQPAPIVPINNMQSGSEMPVRDISSPNDSTEELQAAKGGKVPLLLSPGEKKLAKKDIPKVLHGASPMALGKTVPGKAPVPGAKDSYTNDIVRDDGDEGDLILPRSVTQSKNPEEAARKFVRDTLMKNGGMIPRKKK